MSPDIFLHNHGVRYDNVDGLKGTPAEIVANLKTLNATRFVGDGNLVEIVYRTPGFVPTPMNPDTFANASTLAFKNAINKYVAICNSGASLAEIHAAVDAINDIRMVAGGAEFIPKSDYQIVSGQKTAVGALAKVINSQRLRLQEAIEQDPDNLPIGLFVPWFDTAAGWMDIASFTATTVSEGKPSVNILRS